MSMPLADQIVFTVMLLLIGTMMWFVPVMKGQDAFFGIPVSTEFYRGAGARRCLQLYRVITGLMVAGPLGFLLYAGRAAPLGPGVVLTAVLIAGVGPTVPLVAFWYVVRPHELKRAPGELAPAQEPRSKWRYVTPWVEAVLLATLLLAVALTTWRYPHLPDGIPTHWNAVGQADGWHPKSLLPILSILLVMAFMHAMLLWLLVGMAQVPVRLPAERPHEYAAAHEHYMRLWAAFTNVLRGATHLVFLGIVWASLSGIERQEQGGIPPGMILVLAGTAVLFLSLPWHIVKVWRGRAEMRAIAGPGTIEQVTPTEGWIAGAIYYNRNDPSIWVEKRLGVGWTLNMAHPVSWLFMALAFGVPIGIAILALAGVKG